MIKIHADMRESATIAELKQYPDVHVEVGSLPTGDFRIGEEVIVERKTAMDFIQSIMDKRLFEQVAKMKISFERPIIFIEGDVYATRSEISVEAIDGAATNSLGCWYAWPSKRRGISMNQGCVRKNLFLTH